MIAADIPNSLATPGMQCWGTLSEPAPIVPGLWLMVRSDRFSRSEVTREKPRSRSCGSI